MSKASCLIIAPWNSSSIHHLIAFDVDVRIRAYSNWSIAAVEMCLLGRS